MLFKVIAWFLLSINVFKCYRSIGESNRIETGLNKRYNKEFVCSACARETCAQSDYCCDNQLYNVVQLNVCRMNVSLYPCALWSSSGDMQLYDGAVHRLLVPRATWMGIGDDGDAPKLWDEEYALCWRADAPQAPYPAMVYATLGQGRTHHHLDRRMHLLISHPCILLLMYNYRVEFPHSKGYPTGSCVSLWDKIALGVLYRIFVRCTLKR